MGRRVTVAFAYGLALAGCARTPPPPPATEMGDIVEATYRKALAVSVDRPGATP
jgi:hypothetical protein